MMLTTQTSTNREYTPLELPSEYRVAQMYGDDRAAIHRSVWEKLRGSDEQGNPTNGVLWHRPETQWRGILDEVAGVIDTCPACDAYEVCPNSKDIDWKVRRVFDTTGLTSLFRPETTELLVRELTESYRFVLAATGSERGVFAIRVEEEEGSTENFHLDFGFSSLLALHGPGPSFTPSSNIPAEFLRLPDPRQTTNQSIFFRDDLLNPELVIGAPTNVALFMRGRSQDSMAEGLWHASPSKVYQGRTMWAKRLLLIASCPVSAILPCTPNLDEF